MTDAEVGLVDTSVFIARESGRALAKLPERVALSVITIGELQLGVLNAHDSATKARRADTLALARAADPIPISEAVMVSWARLVADCQAAGVHRAVKLTDALIAATAIEHGLPVITQDADFDQIARACPALTVIKV
ncbi:VapC toxin family PIN domain ribonuclease [Mycobacterium branderi]|uniref:Ribonuclease VapC n=1 Tax=Mycobacterium branderi TaxID=43348 RepID=A0A7I7W4F8_9MYCO|nr:PIN domain-containing protein [Mycobacterium branderi]ORA36715.1 VapC toxin family PIN domain ribonuclease [Mycobacterium branderi]BBZ11323.1 ribonuclease VapC8 [Mycobacterium branderi]